jgi:cytochrome c551/c552
MHRIADWSFVNLEQGQNIQLERVALTDFSCIWRLNLKQQVHSAQSAYSRSQRVAYEAWPWRAAVVPPRYRRRPVRRVKLTVMDAANIFLPSSAPASLSAIVMCVLLAVLSMIALCIVRGVAGDDGEPRAPGKQLFLRMALITGALQVALAPVALALLAPAGLATRTYIAFELALAALIIALILIWRELADPTRGSGTRFPLIAALFAIAGIGLISARIIHRDEVSYAYLLAHPPKVAVVSIPTSTASAVTTAAVTTAPAASTATPAPVAVSLGNDPEVLKGESVFKLRCAICHMVDRRLVGPPLQEVAKIYKGNPAGIVTWAKAPTPVPKRASEGYPPMIPVVAPDEDLLAAAKYILKIAATPDQPEKK